MTAHPVGKGLVVMNGDSAAERPEQSTLGQDLPAAPAPLPEPGRPRKRSTLIVVSIVLGVVVALLACAGVVAGAIALLWSQRGRAQLETASRPPSWAANGRYLVFEYADTRTKPAQHTVWAYDVERRVLNKLPGYSLATVEPDAPVAWVFPQSDPHAGWLTDDTDHAVTGLRAWRVDSDATPTVATRWTPWKSRAGNAVLLTVDPAKGAYPSKITFLPRGATQPVPPEVEMTHTVTPIGWSPSGRFFAVGITGPAMDASGYRPTIPGQVFAFDAQTGKVASYYSVSYKDPEDLSSAWAGDGDVLWTASTETIRDETYGCLDHSDDLGGAGSGKTRKWIKTALNGRFVGSDEQGPVVMYGSSTNFGGGGPADVSRQEASCSRVTSVGPVAGAVFVPDSSRTVALSPRGQLAWNDANKGVHIVITDLEGENRDEVWADEVWSRQQ